MKSTLTSAVVALGIAATAVQAHAETDFSTLVGIPAEPMNAAEMDAVQGKAYTGSVVDGQYLLWYDNRFSLPFAFNLNLPAVQQVYAWWQAVGVADPNTLLGSFYQADPNAVRLVLLGSQVSNLWDPLLPLCPGCLGVTPSGNGGMTLTFP